jgi:DNA-directed RNA polymerase subunit F
MINQKNYQTCKLIRNRIDLYLYEMASLFTNIGIDSTVEEIQYAYRKEREYIELIAELDPEKADRLRSSY